MKNERNTVAPRFSAASATYDLAAVVQPAVAGKLCEMLAGNGSPDTILEIGCGTGILTEKLACLFPRALISAVDVSEKMVFLSQRRLGGNSRVRWTVADMRRLRETEYYNLIASSSALHWIDPFGAGLKKLSRLTSEGGRLVFGLMVEGTLKELRDARLRVAPHKPPRGKLPSVHEVRVALREAGLKIRAERDDIVRPGYPCASALLRSLHDQGVTGGGVSWSAAPLNRDELRRLAVDYDASYGSGGGVFATYRIAYFFAEK